MLTRKYENLVKPKDTAREWGAFKKIYQDSEKQIKSSICGIDVVVKNRFR